MGRRSLLLIASVLVAAAGTAMIWLYVKSADDRARSGLQMVNVLVATAAINPNTSAAALDNSAYVAVKQVPAIAVPGDLVTSLKGLGTQTTRQTIYTGQMLIREQFGDPGAANGIPDKQMGIAVSMEDPNRVAGLLRPGSHVSVYWIRTTGAAGDTRAPAAGSVANLFPDMTVAAVGGTTMTLNDKGTPAKVGTQSGVPTAVVTLDATGKQSATLMLAQANGTLYFTLLGNGAQGSRNDGTSLTELPDK
jgi:pilus assembly protein CpaB